jgi:hypothetical protein
MSDLTIQETTQYNITELTLVTKIGYVDIKDKFEEINIFDSILNQTMSGNILIRDAVGLSEQLVFDGSEVLLVKIGKDEDELLIQKSFRIYKQSNRVAVNQTSEIYVLHFVSDEHIFSLQQKVQHYYNMTYSEAAVKIMNDYLSVKNIGIYSSSFGVRNILVPSLEPLVALQWLATRAVDENQSPGFIFFENRIGFNFTNLSTLFSFPSLTRVNFSAKNISDSLGEEFTGARSFEVITQNDFINNTKSGVYAGKMVGFDPLTRTVQEKNHTFKEMYDNGEHANKTPNVSLIKNRNGNFQTEMYNSRVVTYPSFANRKNSDYIKENDPTSASLDDDTENYIFQREAIFQNLFSKRVKIVLPGNFKISSGFCVDLDVPKKSVLVDGENPFDSTLYGKYLIIATRHIIRPNMHEVVIEAVTDSSNYKNKGENTVFTSTVDQEKAIYYAE